MGLAFIIFWALALILCYWAVSDLRKLKRLREGGHYCKVTVLESKPVLPPGGKRLREYDVTVRFVPYGGSAEKTMTVRQPLLYFRPGQLPMETPVYVDKQTPSQMAFEIRLKKDKALAIMLLVWAAACFVFPIVVAVLYYL